MSADLAPNIRRHHSRGDIAYKVNGGIQIRGGSKSPIFLVEKPSNETTATTFNISGIQAQHDQVAVAIHGVTTETRYIHVHVPKKQNSNFMYINGNA